ncbi:MAG: hypothetical protein ACM3QS_13585, partial [Bacteroidota bacterium]
PLQMGQRVRYLHTRTGTGVFAWDLPHPPDPDCMEVSHYKELLFRAAYEILQPLGVTEKILRTWLFARAGYIHPSGLLHASPPGRRDLPLFSSLERLRVELL